MLTVEQSKFYEAKLMLLTKHQAKLEETTDIWTRPLFTSQILTIFIHLDSNTISATSFSPKIFCKAALLSGLEVYAWTATNLQHVVQQLKSPTQHATLLVGYAYIVDILAEQTLPANNKKSKKKRIQMLKEWHQEKKHSCVHCMPHNTLIFWDPFPLYATHKIMVSQESLVSVIDELNAHEVDPMIQKPQYLSFSRLEGEIQVVDIASCVNQPASLVLSLLNGTMAEGLHFPPSWDAHSLAPAGTFAKSIEKDLNRKLAFVNPEAKLFSGKNLLEDLVSRQNSPPIINVLLCLELIAMDVEQSTSKDCLDEYLGTLKIRDRSSTNLKMTMEGTVECHPLALLAMARLATKNEAQRYFKTLLYLYPAAIKWLSDSEKLATEEIQMNLTTSPTTSRFDAFSRWMTLKDEDGVHSIAMEKLMALTGLEKVKVKAVELFKTAVQLQRMTPSARQKNLPRLNFCFLGNPGTGKTTVARLFAKILHDSKLRSSSSTKHCTAQEVKDEGIDDFRKSWQSVMDGTLFIDEAYDLDPKSDFKGKPIVNELVTLSEDKRDSISIILAGYEDDISTKLFAYNEGLRSRFDNVYFDDFDEQELTAIWGGMLAEKEWQGLEPKLTRVVIKRIVKQSGRKGFGNARTIRNKIEASVAAAYCRDDFDAQNMSLEIEDILGPDPRENPKLREIQQDLEKKIGWKSIKKSVEELIQVCGTNYERELDGLPPQAIFLNRLFLGNPGTGKTTCAKIYGSILKHLGFLSIGDVVFKTAGDFGGSVVGESQKKSLQILEGARGKVLVIDEAYSLNDGGYGRQVLDTFVEKVQGTESDDIAVLLLGYTDPMRKMLKDNPGLSRRFPEEYAFNFEDFDEKELLRILKLKAKEQQIELTSKFQEKALCTLESQKQAGSNFGNAGAVDSLLKVSCQRASSRTPNTSTIELDACDIPGDDDKNSEALEGLDKLYRMDEVKKRIQGMKNAFIIADQEGDERPQLGHFVFTGSPGTGKTTVARFITSILYGLKLLNCNRFKETSALKLTGEYVGQTKKKVEEQLKDAKGGVLFIDEAYELGKGSFGEEACTSLVAAMTDPEFVGTVIIIAGYKQQIDAMLNTNAGLKSRFTEFFDFPDWRKEDCLHWFKQRAETASFIMDDTAFAVLDSGFDELISLPGWGNARDVDKLWKAALKERASRVVASEHKELERTLQEVDLRVAMNAIVVSRTPPRKIHESFGISGHFESGGLHGKMPVAQAFGNLNDGGRASLVVASPIEDTGHAVSQFRDISDEYDMSTVIGLEDEQQDDKVPIHVSEDADNAAEIAQDQDVVAQTPVHTSHGRDDGVR